MILDGITAMQRADVVGQVVPQDQRERRASRARAGAPPAMPTGSIDAAIERREQRLPRRVGHDHREEQDQHAEPGQPAGQQPVRLPLVDDRRCRRPGAPRTPARGRAPAGDGRSAAGCSARARGRRRCSAPRRRRPGRPQGIRSRIAMSTSGATRSFISDADDEQPGPDQRQDARAAGWPRGAGRPAARRCRARRRARRRAWSASWVSSSSGSLIGEAFRCGANLRIVAI